MIYYDLLSLNILIMTSISRYFLKVTIMRRIADITQELDIAVHTLSTYPEMNNRFNLLVF